MGEPSYLLHFPPPLLAHFLPPTQTSGARAGAEFIEAERKVDGVLLYYLVRRSGRALNGQITLTFSYGTRRRTSW